MSKTEKRLTEDCLYSESQDGSVLFRNDNGMGFRKDGTPFRYGILPGSGDQLGWKEIVITKEMVGSKIAQFQSIEIKTEKDSISYQQIIWLLNVRIAGGRGHIYTEKGFLTLAEVLKLPRRKEKPAEEAKFRRILTNLLKRHYPGVYKCNNVV